MVRFLLTCCAILVSLASAEAQVPEGVIIQIQAPEPGTERSVALVRRGDDEFTATPLMHLLKGDVVEILDSGGRLSLEDADGEAMWLQAADSPFEVDRGSIRSEPTELQRQVGALIDWNNRRTVILATRADNAPLLEAFSIPGARIGPRDGPFLVVWRPTEPPYSVTLTVGEEEESKASILETSAEFDIQVSQGDAVSIVVQDSAGARSAAELRVEDVPDVPPELAEGLPPRLGQVIGAAWLASQDYQAWMPEALQQLAPLLGTYPPADDLAELFAIGVSP